MTSTEITIKLPSIGSSKVISKEEEGVASTETRQTSQGSVFLSRLQLGSLKPHKRPGDVWAGGSHRQPRPLGLIPNHNDKFDILKELSRFLPPLTTYTKSSVVVHYPSDEGVKNNADEPHKELISANAKTPKDQSTNLPQTCLSDATPPGNILGVEPSLPYRLPADHQHHNDTDYFETLATLDLRSYYPVYQPHPQHSVRETWSGSVQPMRSKTAAHPSRIHSVSSGPQFLSFSEQSQLWRRGLSDNRRQPTPWEPCARCVARGGRCQRCKALRVGGGYIILDGDELSDEQFRKRHGKRYKHRYNMSNGDKAQLDSDRGKNGGVGSDGGSRLSVNGDKSDAHDKDNNGGGVEGVDYYNGLGGSGNADDRLSGRSGRDQFGVNDADRRLGHGTKNGRGHADGDTSRRSGSDTRDGVNSKGSDAGGASRQGESWAGDGREGGDDSERGANSRGGGIGQSGRAGSSLSSRPGSSLGRQGLGRQTRDNQTTELEGAYGKGRSRGRGDGDHDSDSSNDEGRGRRRRRKVTDDNAEGGQESNDRPKFKFGSTRNDEERPASGYHGNLMRFKRKKDEVKAKHATLAELQGIDPLDYLARYCIIDQSKLPHYQRCYDNVDRDEDDEIDIGELDFALKAVNYDLISDSEMSYVHSVLELTGRYKLNFRLFSLIAALSEKVVALEDMVKRLINKMDFEALEVKMKKCKELFYLLADTESTSAQHEGGVVTTSSLAVELQAGGLTSDHVEFVVERLNHEGKGLVEFLDYLTYVPLFVEIHDSIYGNPLDFSRTK